MNGGGIGAAVNTGLTTPNARALAIDPATPTTLYAGFSGVFKSVNGGGKWSEHGRLGVHALALDPAPPDTLYVGTCGRRRVQEHERRQELDAILRTGEYLYPRPSH